ncbi:MAG: hypothetical protein A2W91_15345 [Bacteroidetes bacterium GWF2_38_335]|nr:MAG: hypothetical protein A2W91_15345 [Bacteroidetes bacterium GWF2_38_335]OFY81047.1 MAG: hypothetical protein A2281_13135 [Bacteroidetes bacterium RIFOXYA12_FULL_38_20]
MNKKHAIIIGAGPAGLTAAKELLDKTDIIPVILEASANIGGISKTVNYKGNHIDIGGHRFFSKSDRVMDWWLNILPVQKTDGVSPNEINYQNKSKEIDLEKPGPDPNESDRVMLVRKRLSRIIYLRKFFDYPVSLNFNTIKNLGPVRLVKIAFSYLWIRLFPIKNEKTLEEFFINRFGKQLYKTFFRDYTEKVWGVKCSQISAEWGAQRIKGLSVSKALVFAIKKMFSSKKSIRQKNIETTLIEQFLYPKFGPGHLWNEVAEYISEKGGQIHLNWVVEKINLSEGKIMSVNARNILSDQSAEFNGDYFFSTMPVKDLVKGMSGIQIPAKVMEVANGLIYRDFVTVGLLLNKLTVHGKETSIKDNWIYVQESDVKVGRLQFFNNWSPYMVADPSKTWIGMEYFCNEGDDLWNMNEDEMKKFAALELEKIKMILSEDVVDSVVIKVPKTYPAYFGSYPDFQTIRDFTDKFENLFLVGRNGMHKYNNMDHSMLTAMVAVENIINGIKTKENIWQVNTEQEYHEEK